MRGLTSAGDEGVLLVVADDAVRSANANPGLGLHGGAKSLRGDSSLGVEGGTLEARPEGRREAWEGSGCQPHTPKLSPSMVPQKNCVTMFPCPLAFFHPSFMLTLSVARDGKRPCDTPAKESQPRLRGECTVRNEGSIPNPSSCQPPHTSIAMARGWGDTPTPSTTIATPLSAGSLLERK